MRNFRTAAVAAATAVTVAFAGVSAASASDLSSASKNAAAGASSEGKGSLSSKVGSKTGADKPANGRDLLGSSVKDEKNPDWAVLWRDGTYAAMGTAAVAAVVAAYNFAVYNGVIPDYLAQFVKGLGI